MKTFLKYTYYLIPIVLVVLIVSIADTSMSKSNQVQTPRPVVDLWGVTCELINDDEDENFVNNVVKSISELRCDVTTRIVFHPDEENDPYVPNPEMYDGVTDQVKSVSKVMGLFLDSYYWSEDLSDWSFGRETLITRLNAFTDNTSLLSDVDIWEIGNEVNGDWVHDGDYAQVQSDLDTLLKLAKSKISTMASKTTAITLYFYADTTCVDEEHPNYSGDPNDYMMLHWATTFVNNYPDAINNIDYVFISYYRLDCPTTSEGWYWDSQIDSLTKLFPNSLVGFGEIGWPDNNEPSPSTKVNIINTYYPYTPLYYPTNYPWIHAGFYWNYDYDCIELTYGDYANSPVWRAIDSIMGECNNDGDRLGNNIKTNFESKINFNYSLSQNYPNPFNPVTKINFALPKSGFVSLKIYDMLGREVRTLVNEIKSVGNYSVDFNASDLSSGIYFYRLETNGFSDVKKMMLIK